MKRLGVLLILAIFFFTACTKRFPDGPLISFKSVKRRIVGTWQLDNYLANGTDSASIINNLLGASATLQFQKYREQNTALGDYTFQWGNDTANYFLSNGLYGLRGTTAIFITLKPLVVKSPKNLYIALGDPNCPPLRVLKCEYTTLWLGFEIGNRSYQLHLSRVGGGD